MRRLAVPIAGILGSSAERGKEVCQPLRIPRACESLAETPSDPAVDVGTFARPTISTSQVSTLLRAGKNVLCEKPLAMDTTQSAALVDLAHSEGRVGGVSYNLRYYPR
jgi:predicted dehydrogenase